MAATPDPIRDRFESQRLQLFASRGFPGRSHRVPDGAGNETYMVIGGDGSPTRVLIHGGLSDASSCAVLAGRLTGRLAIPDRPGYGLSYPIDYRRVADFQEAAADWLESVVDGLGEDQVDLIGTSMGGFFTIAFTIRHPERVRRLVLLAAPFGVDRQVSWFLRLWANPITGRLFMRSTPDSPEQLRERVYSGLVAHPERVPAEQLEVEYAAQRLPDFAVTAHSMLRAVINLRGFRSRYLIRDQLKTLQTPTLFAWGDKDVPPTLGQDIAAHMPNAKFVVLPDAGHVPWIDEPDLTADTVNRYLAMP